MQEKLVILSKKLIISINYIMKINSFLIKTIIAHRGVHYRYLENTVLAFNEAINRNYTIEFDIRVTKDNQIVVFHDSNLKRIFGINRDVDDLTLDELKKYRYIPTLEEVLSLINGKVPIIIDVKTYNKKLINILDNYNGEFSIQSFNPLILYKIKIVRPNYIIGYLIYKFLYLKSILLILKPDYIATNLNNLELISKYKNKYIILGYTLKTKKEYQKYKNLVDNFICDIRWIR